MYKRQVIYTLKIYERGGKVLAVSAVVRAVAGKPRKLALRGYRRCNVVVLRSFDDEAVVSAAVAYHFFQFFLAVIYLSTLKNRIAEIALVCPYIHVYSFSGGSEIVSLPFYHKNKLLSIALAENCFIVAGVEEKVGTPVLPVKVHELLE